MIAVTALTREQRDMARHALGLPNRRQTSYRNHYVINQGGEGHAAWMALVEVGLARRRQGSALTGDCDVFWLNRAGALAVLEPGESLAEVFRQ